MLGCGTRLIRRGRRDDAGRCPRCGGPSYAYPAIRWVRVFGFPVWPMERVQVIRRCTICDRTEDVPRSVWRHVEDIPAATSPAEHLVPRTPPRPVPPTSPSRKKGGTTTAVLAVLFVATAGYLGYAVYLGPAVPVALLNGTPAPAVFSIGDERTVVEPFSVNVISLPAGEHAYRMQSGSAKRIDGSLTLSSPLLLRPFRRTITVLNPDGRGLLGRGEAMYQGNGSRMSGNGNAKVFLFRPGVLSEQPVADFTFTTLPDRIERTAADPTTVSGVLRTRWLGPPAPFTRSLLIARSGSRVPYQRLTPIPRDVSARDIALENRFLASRSASPISSSLAQPGEMAEALAAHSNPASLLRQVIRNDSDIDHWADQLIDSPVIATGQVRAALRELVETGDAPKLRTVLARSEPLFRDAEPLLRAAHNDGEPTALTPLCAGLLATDRPNEAIKLLAPVADIAAEIAWDLPVSQTTPEYRTRLQVASQIRLLRQAHAAIGNFSPILPSRVRNFTQQYARGGFVADLEDAFYEGAAARGSGDEYRDRKWPFFVGLRSRERARAALRADVHTPILDATRQAILPRAVILDNVNLLYSQAAAYGYGRRRDLIAAVVYLRLGHKGASHQALDRYLRSGPLPAQIQPFDAALSGQQRPPFEDLEQAWPPVVEKAMLLTLVGVRYPGLRSWSFALAERLNFTPGIEALLIEETIEGYKKLSTEAPETDFSLPESPPRPTNAGGSDP